MLSTTDSTETWRKLRVNAEWQAIRANDLLLKYRSILSMMISSTSLKINGIYPVLDGTTSTNDIQGYVLNGTYETFDSPVSKITIKGTTVICGTEATITLSSGDTLYFTDAETGGGITTPLPFSGFDNAILSV